MAGYGCFILSDFCLVDKDELMEFMVRVSDSGDLVLDSYVSVTITVTSEPIPVFSSDKVQIFVSESIAIGSEITKVSTAISHALCAVINDRFVTIMVIL